MLKMPGSEQNPADMTRRTDASPASRALRSSAHGSQDPSAEEEKWRRVDPQCMKEFGAPLFRDDATSGSDARSLENSLHHEWSQCAREKIPLGVVVIRLDRFDELSSRHPEDAQGALQAVAGIMRVIAIRRRDRTFRRADGFLTLLPGTHAEGVNYLASRLVHAVCELQLARVSPALPSITATVGGAVVLPVAGGNPQQLILKAEQALAGARGSGRHHDLQA